MRDSRAAFEAWHEGEFDPSNPHVNVVFSLKETRWKAWTAARASQWREISDSQKDGNTILGTGPEIGTHVVWWNSEPTLGGYTWRISESEISLHEDAITHWQPLPQPPVSK